MRLVGSMVLDENKIDEVVTQIETSAKKLGFSVEEYLIVVQVIAEKFYGSAKVVVSNEPIPEDIFDDEDDIHEA